MKKVIIIDGNSLAYSRIPDPEKFKDNLLYSSIDKRDIFIVRKFMKQFLTLKYIIHPDYDIVVVFDEQNKFTFRHKLDEKYKSKSMSEKRQQQKDYVYSQIEEIKKILNKMNVPCYSSPDWEADDVIGMLVEDFESKKIFSTIISGDKDILQLISSKTRIQFTSPDNQKIMTDRKNVWDLSGGVWPDQVIDIKILSGDASDNIKGLGLIRNGKIDYWKKEEAAELIKKWGSIDSMIKNIDKIKDPYKKSLLKGKDKIEHNRKLTTIIRKWSIDVKPDFFLNKKIIKKNIQEIIKDLNLDGLNKNKRFRKNTEVK